MKTSANKLASNKAYHLRNREKIRVQQKARYDQNRNAMLAEMKVRYRKRYANPEYRARLLKGNSEWSRQNPDSNRRAALAWRNRNILKARASASRWLKANPAYRTAKNHKRAALLKKASVNLLGIKEFIRETKSKKSFVCYYCDSRFPISRLHFDHIVALASGGEHSVRNLCTACAPCNQSKQAKSISVWKTSGQQLLSI